MAKQNEEDYLEIDIVKRAMEIGHQYIATEATRAYWWDCSFHCGKNSPNTPPLESPAEAVFQVCFSAHQLFDRHFYLERQVQVEAAGSRYRFDFVVHNLWRNREQMPLAIEVDGHAFHEKTLDQITYRNRRDRAIQQAGFTVFHFSFSELMRDPMGCVSEVADSAYKMHLKASEPK